jgi:hypothetical protein
MLNITKVGCLLNIHILSIVMTAVAANLVQMICVGHNELIYITLSLLSVCSLTINCSTRCKIYAITWMAISASIASLYTYRSPDPAITLIVSATALGVVGLCISVRSHATTPVMRGSHWGLLLFHRYERQTRVMQLVTLCYQLIEPTQSMLFVAMWMALKVAGLPGSLCRFDAYEMIPLAIASCVVHVSTIWDAGPVSVCIGLSAFVAAKTSAQFTFVLVCQYTCVLFLSFVRSFSKIWNTHSPGRTHTIECTTAAQHPSMMNTQECQRAMMISWSESTATRRSCISCRNRCGSHTLDILCAFGLVIAVSNALVFVLGGCGKYMLAPLVVYIQDTCLELHFLYTCTAADSNMQWYWVLLFLLELTALSIVHPGRAGTRALMAMEHTTPLISMVVSPILCYHLLIHLSQHLL